MKLLYAEGFPNSEREEWRATIFSNLINAFKVILDAMEEYGIDFGNPANMVGYLSVCITRYKRLRRLLVGIRWHHLS